MSSISEALLTDDLSQDDLKMVRQLLGPLVVKGIRRCEQSNCRFLFARRETVIHLKKETKPYLGSCFLVILRGDDVQAESLLVTDTEEGRRRFDSKVQEICTSSPQCRRCAQVCSTKAN